MNAREIFDYVLPYKNVLTPNEVGFFANEDYTCQLTKGDPAFNMHMYGVTTVDLKLRKRVGRKSELFTSDKSDDDAREQAIEFINKVLSRQI